MARAALEADTVEVPASLTEHVKYLIAAAGAKDDCPQCELLRALLAPEPDACEDGATCTCLTVDGDCPACP